MPQIRTQYQQVQDWLKREPLTAMQAQIHLGVARLAARINELREDGFPVQSEMIEVQDRYGRVKRVAKYSMGA